MAYTNAKIYEVINETEQLALDAKEGDVVKRTDESISYMHNGGTTGTMADWTKLSNSIATYIDQSGGTSDTYGVLAGTIDGVNKVFTVSQGKYTQGSLIVSLNGQLQTQGTGEDWTETTPTSGTFTFIIAPVSGDEILVKYGVADVSMPVIADTEIVANKAWSSQKIDSRIPSRIIVVNSESDFPTPVAGTITLEDGVHYIINQVVITANDFFIPDTATVQFSVSLPSVALVYVGTGSMFTTSSNFVGVLAFHYFVLTAPAGTIFNIDGQASGNFISIHAIYNGCVNMGTIKGIGNFITDAIITDYSTGIVLESNFVSTIANSRFILSKNSPNTKTITISGNHGNIRISDNFFNPQTNENNFLIEQTSTTVGGVISGNSLSFLFGGGNFDPNSKNQTDKQWKFTGNTNVEDSTVKAKMSISNNTNTTTITVSVTPTKINTLWQDGSIEERMEFQDECTFNNTTNTITTTFTHALTVDDEINFYTITGTLPAEIETGKTYYVSAVTATTFQISETKGGATFNFTDNGTPTNYFRHVTGNNQGLIIYTGLEDVSVRISGWVRIENTTGTSVDTQAIIMKVDTDGTATLFEEGSFVNVSNSWSYSSQVDTIIDLKTNQGVEVYIENNTNTDNLKATDSRISFSKS